MPSFVEITMILQSMTHAKLSVETIRDHYLKKDEIKNNLKKMEKMLDENKTKILKNRSLDIKINEFKYDQNIILKNFNLEIKKVKRFV